MSAQYFKRLGQIAVIVLLSTLTLLGSLAVINGLGLVDAQAATIFNDTTESQTVDTPHQQICDCSRDAYNCEDFESQEVAQACFDYCQKIVDEDIHDLDRNRDGVACEDTQYGTPPPDQAEPAEEQPAEEEVPGSNNLVFNGNFEFGFYTVPELGFEPPDVGHVPNSWNWFKNEKYGKYNIYNNEGFGLICPDDVSQETTGKNSLTINIQSTDQSDARIGVYQTVNVVPGRDYLFSISGTIEVQEDGDSPDRNHRVLLYFDQQGGTDWRAIPHEDWTDIRWFEQRLEFKRSGPDDPDIADIEDYHEVVTAESDKLTIFIMAWRRWANWRTGIYTFDCVSLVPLNEVNVGGLVPRLSEISVTTVDQALEAGAAVPAGSEPPAAEPAVVPADGAESAAPPPAESVIIPPSGGVIESTGNALLIGAVSVVLILGLVGAGIWNARRQK
jgi:hypothetical protein